MAEHVHSTKSYAKGVDIAPRKVSVVASLVRNRIVADALVILDHVPRRAGLASQESDRERSS
jgi:ribosomal protein L22